MPRVHAGALTLAGTLHLQLKQELQMEVVRLLPLCPELQLELELSLE